MYFGYLVGGDEISLTDAVRITTKFSRRHPSAKLGALATLNSKLCAASCGSVATEAHHIKPIWAMAVESVIDCNPVQQGGFYRSISRMWSKSFDYSSWHHPTNLLPLCDLCHLREQEITNRVWKLSLMQRHPIVFHKTWADDYIRQQFRKYKDVSFTEYTKMYFEKEMRELGG